MTSIPQNTFGRIKFLFLNKDLGHYTLFLCLIWCKELVLTLGRVSVTRSELTAFLAPSIDALILFLLLPIAIKSIVAHIRIKDILFCFICVLIYLVQYILHLENSEILSEYAPLFILSTLPMYLMGIQLDINKFQNAFRDVSIAVVIFCVFYSFIYSPRVHGAMDENGEVMNLAYMLSPHVIYLLWQFIKNFSWSDFFASTIGFFMLLSFGTRGPIVCVATFFIFYFLFINDLKYKFAWALTLIIAGGIIYYFSDQIILHLYNLMPRIGMSNRIFAKLIAGEFAGYENSSERDVILLDLWEAMKRSDFFGYGIGGSWLISGGYAHNIYFDFIVSFGFYPGSILFVFVCTQLIRGFVACRNNDEKAFFLVLFACGFVKLFISNIYLNEPYFWLLIGYCTFLIRNKHINKCETH